MQDYKTKYVDKTKDNYETSGIAETVNDWLGDLSLPFPEADSRTWPIEYLSRDGFFAASHNCGGTDLLVTTNASYLLGSGSHAGLKIQAAVEDDEQTAIDSITAEQPDASQDDIFDATHDYLCEVGYGWRVRVMYEGNKTVTVHAGYDHDAPYYRWRNAADYERTIEYTDNNNLRAQLDAMSSELKAIQ